MGDMLIPPLEMRETIRASPVGECIYCGSGEGLSDEHVIPFALGGRLILPDASCATCAAMTSGFERKVLRGFMLAPRTAAGFPSRRPKERPTSFPLEVRVTDEYVTQDVTAGEFPALLTLPLLAPPAFLYARSYQPNLELVGHETISFGTTPEEAIRLLGGIGLRMTVKCDVHSYARLLAKIALGYAVASLGRIPRDEVPVLPVIFGDFTHAGKWMGASEFQLDIEDKRPTHALGLHLTPDPAKVPNSLIFARVKLFANSGATGYEVAVWRPSVMPPQLTGA